MIQQAYAYLLHLSSGFILLGVFFWVYTKITPFQEISMIRIGNVAAALSLAGALVAHSAGEPWQDYAERRILRPLGMTTATYREPYPAATARARGLPSPMPAATAARVSSGFDLKAGKEICDSDGVISTPHVV